MSKTAHCPPRKPDRTSRATTTPTRRRTDEVLLGAPLQRVWHVHARLSREERVTAETLAAELEVSSRTIKRDLDVMRDRLGMPIEWDAVGKTYYYTRECDTLPLLRIDTRDALALALVGRVCASSDGVPFGRRLDAILKKIAPVLGGAVSIAVDSLEHVHPPAAAGGLDEFEHFFPILEAIQHRGELRLEYLKAVSTRAAPRIVHPLHLARLDQRWVLVAHDCTRGGLRHFVLARIRNITPTRRSFDRPANFDAQRYIRGCLGAFAGDKEYKVRIALDAHAAFYARESPWHPSQQLAARPDGRVELTIRINHLADAKNAVLRWGEHAEVLAPPELRTAVAAALQAALAQYHSG